MEIGNICGSRIDDDIEYSVAAMHMLVDSYSIFFVKMLQEKEIPVIAFSAAPGGKIRKEDTDDFIDWRIQELGGFGFDFSRAFPDIETLQLPKDSDKEFPPIYKSGVLISSLHDKGSVLSHFFKELGWTPKQIVFVDDSLPNIQSVVEALEGEVQTIGVHYTAASELPCDLDERAAKYQVDHFLETGEWISQSDAQARLNISPASPKKNF